jgi:hypothetical protein
MTVRAVLKAGRVSIKVGVIIIAAAMALMSIPMFQQSLIGGFAFLVLPIGWLVFTLLRTIFKSIWGCFFLFLGFGLVEVALGIVNVVPLSWFVFSYIFFFYMVFSAIKWFLNQKNRAELAKNFKSVDSETAQGSSRTVFNYADERDYFNYFE